MRRVIIIVCLILIFSAIISCKKDKANDNDNQNTAVYAGVYDETFIYEKYSPPLGIYIKWDSLNLYGYGKDSVDIDLNENFDLFFSLSVINYDSIHLLHGGLPNPFPYCRIGLRDNFEITEYIETFPIGLGQTGTATFVDTMKYKSRIDQLTNWYKDTFNSIAMWQKNPGTGGLPSFGGWYYAKKTMYIGLKTYNNKFGWIEVDGTDPENPLIKSYAIKK